MNKIFAIIGCAVVFAVLAFLTKKYVGIDTQLGSVLVPAVYIAYGSILSLILSSKKEK